MRVAKLLRFGVALGLATATLGGCSSTPDHKAFCDAAVAAGEAGPIFGEPLGPELLPNYVALDALVTLGEKAPDELKADLDILVAEAKLLVAEAEAHLGTNPNPPTEAHQSAQVLQAAQQSVTTYVEATCQLNLAG